MEQSQELSKALEELTRATGIALDIHIQPEASKEKIDESIRQIRSLCAAYKEKYNKNYFLLNLMTGTVQDCEISERAARLHIRTVKPRYLFFTRIPKKNGRNSHRGIETIVSISRKNISRSCK